MCCYNIQVVQQQITVSEIPKMSTEEGQLELLLDLKLFCAALFSGSLSFVFLLVSNVALLVIIN